MSPSFIITVSSLVFLLLFSLSLFGFIIVRRLMIARRQVRFRRLYAKIEQDVLEAITLLNPDSTLKVAREHKDHPQVLTKVLLDFGDMILGEGKDHLGIIFNSALRDCCLKQLNAKRTSKRLQSVRLFVSFLDPSENGRLLRLLDDKPIIKLAAISALSRVPSIEMMRYIFRAFEEDAGAAVRSYFNIMFSLGDRIEPFVKSRLKSSCPAEKLGLLVELVGAIPLRSLFDQVVPLAGHPDKEVRIRVARTLGKMLLPEAAGTLLALASDEAWEVQAQAVKSLGKLKDRSALDTLTGALFSPFWYVRFNAGYGLAEMGEEGLRRLKRVAAQQVDRYAREMSVMVLNDSLIPVEAA